MIRTVILAALVLVYASLPAEARHRHHTAVAHPSCNILWPCADVVSSPRGERVVRAMGGFGSPQMVYAPRVANFDYRAAPVRPKKAKRAKQPRSETALYEARSAAEVASRPTAQVVAHPSGCPGRAFCGCGASVRVFGHSVRELWLAANWLRFPRTEPAPGMVAARRGHVFVLEQHISGSTWLAYDANSGGHATRIHARSIAGYSIVNPHGSRYASAE